MAIPHGVETGRQLSLVDGNLQMTARFPYTEISPAQTALLERHLQAAKDCARNTASLRDPLEYKHLSEVVAKLYASLDLGMPSIHILGSPMSCAFAWSHTPQGVADRWRVFHDEFYTHPLSSPLVDVIQDGYKAFTRLVEHAITISMTPMLSDPIRQDYRELERVGELVATAVTSPAWSALQDAGLVDMFRRDVEANVGNEAIRAAVLRQPAPKLDSLFLPGAIFRGQQYAETSYFQAMSDLGMPFIGYHKNLISLWEQMNKACHWWFPYKNVLLLSDRPSELHLDDRQRLHNPKGAAIAYRDGWKVYAWKGILIPKEIVETPEKITVSDIMKENNTEVRRAMVDIFGIDRFVVESKSKSLDKQDEYELLEVPYFGGGNMVALKMRCPTTLAVYVHTVHPECTSVEQALAWKRGEDDFMNARPYKEGLIWER